MADQLVQSLAVTGDRVRRGDVITVGGIPHRVRDLHDVHPGRKLLEFEDGNTYVLTRTMLIEITRVYVPERRTSPAKNARGTSANSRRPAYRGNGTPHR